MRINAEASPRNHGATTSWVRVAGLVVAIAAMTFACSSETGPTDPGTPQGASLFVLSGPLTGALTAAPHFLASPPDSSTVTYVSLPPGSIPNGTSASIAVARTGYSVAVNMFAGGFDPVAVPAQEGDTVTIAVDVPDAGPESFTRVVPAASEPIVIRTDPPAHKRDVPLNAVIVVVFSQPIDPTTLNAASFQLLRDSVPVAGTLRLTDPFSLRAEFHTDSLLAVGTSYRLVVTQEVHDVSGAPLQSALSVTFTTLLPRILVDASRDGGVWWFGQLNLGADPSLPHQGKALADSLRALGYTVDEIGYYFISDSLLNRYGIVIRAGFFANDTVGYDPREIAAYQDWVRAGGKLLLLADHMMYTQAPDRLGMSFGLTYAGVTWGTNSLVPCGCDAVTAGVGSMLYNAGSALLSYPDSALIDATLDAGSYLDLNNNHLQDAGEPSAPPVMGTMRYGQGRIVFSGDLNMWELVPEPLIGNVLAWLGGP